MTGREAASNFTRLGKHSHLLDSSFYSQELSGRKNTFFHEIGWFVNSSYGIFSGRWGNYGGSHPWVDRFL